MIETDTTLFKVRDRCAWITLNRPEALNSLNPELRWQLSQHLDQVESDEDIWLTVITGAGERAFCAGADLKQRARERDASPEQQNEWRRLQSETRHIIERWYHPKPIIAMV
ncbi:MAG: enoyl-CoA hydratase/isomerase family protein, partial [Gammaproteobacteria bacterium]|nr:enoyl-CoA hydratase/isomerase family protein [Gammaproteobacteria bacterium]